jgi:hypothetical protein
MSVMKICISLFTLFVTVICGCGCRQVGHGDVGQFILQSAEKFGGTPLATNGLPPITEQWSYHEDTDEVEILISKQVFPAVAAFLHQSFGEPTGRWGRGEVIEYRFSTNGACLFLFDSGKKNITEVIIRRHPFPTLSMMLPNKRIDCIASFKN